MFPRCISRPLLCSKKLGKHSFLGSFLMLSLHSHLHFFTEFAPMLAQFAPSSHLLFAPSFLQRVFYSNICLEIRRCPKIQKKIFAKKVW